MLGNNRNNILEPLTTLIRLCMINYEDPGIKIGINHNKIHFYRSYFFQGPLRKLYNESRENLHNLHNPIQKASEWYDINCLEIKYIFEYSIKGLKKLKESYQSQSIIAHTIDSYAHILEKELKTLQPENYNTNNNNTNSDIFLKELDSNLDETQKGILYKGLISTWDYRTIQTVYNLLN